MRITLIHPPLDDPTLPYHSLAYLKGHLAHSGFHDCSVRDVNIEYVNYCLEPEVIESFNGEAGRRLEALSRRPGLSFSEQEEYYALWSARRFSPESVREAAGGMRDRERFLDFPAYLRDARLITQYFDLLGALSYPTEIVNFKQVSKARYSLYHLNDLLNPELHAKICGPFGRFFEERLAADPDFLHADCFGISVIYDHQLPHALYLARRLKERFPGKPVMLGGTSVSQFYKYLDDKGKMRRFFEVCDAIVVGEGETAICEIARRGVEFPTHRDIPNTITYDAARDALHLPRSIHYEDVSALGTPLYDYPWELYLSPSPGINYAPTRGCYWNRCTFCDYGLNTDSPTSPWRERKVERVIADLRAARARHEGIKYVYFAVDVMAPAYIERLSDALVEANLDIRWCAELRMEKIFSEHRCRKMAQSGCVSISFGMESGNQRVLDLIDKGTSLDNMAATMKNFAAAGVAVQLMAFKDFPTETEEEGAETFKFVEDNRPYWSTGGIGSFMLTGTAIIAREPERFGLKIVETAGVDVARNIAYRTDDDTGRELLLTEERDASFDDNKGVFPQLPDRPWAGATDTLHSMIYYDAYGREFFKEHNLLTAAAPPARLTDAELSDCTIRVPGHVGESAVDLSAIVARRAEFAEHVKKMMLVPVEPTSERFTAWQATAGPLPRQETPDYWISHDGLDARVGRGVYQVIMAATGRDLKIGEVLAALNPALRAPLLEKLKTLGRAGLLEFVRPPHPNGFHQPPEAADSERSPSRP